MNQAISKLKNCAFINKFRCILSSKFFPFITAAITLLCYYLGWDMALIYYIGITGILMLLLLDDVTPVIHVLLFMSVMISLKNSPSPAMGGSDYYHRTENLVQIAIVITAFISAGIYRIVMACAKKKFKVSPVFMGLSGFAAALFFNGVASDKYIPKNLLFALIMAACFLGIYSVLCCNLKLDKNAFEKIAFGFFALSILLVIELIVAYATTEGIFADGKIIRDKLIFGWGLYNNYGVLLVMCIPAVCYLASIKNYGFVYTLYSVVLFVASFFCCSRQAMVGAALIFPFCSAILLIKGKNRFANICIFVAAAIAAIILIAVYREPVYVFFKDIFANIFVDGELDGSGRTKIWREAFNNFRFNPLFGVGFYTKFSYEGKTGLGFMPSMCHDTLLELLSAGGLLLFIAYACHRVQTVQSFFKNVTLERFFIAVTVLAMLIISLMDNHMFNIFPTIIYSSLIAVLSASEQKYE